MFEGVHKDGVGEGSDLSRRITPNFVDASARWEGKGSTTNNTSDRDLAW